MEDRELVAGLAIWAALLTTLQEEIRQWHQDFIKFLNLTTERMECGHELMILPQESRIWAEASDRQLKLEVENIEIHSRLMARQERIDELRRLVGLKPSAHPSTE